MIAARRIKYYEDKAFRRGGTGRSQVVLGISGAVAAFAVLLLAAACTLLACLAIEAIQRPDDDDAPMIPEAYSSYPAPQPFVPSPQALRPLPPVYPSGPVIRRYVPPAPRGR